MRGYQPPPPSLDDFLIPAVGKWLWRTIERISLVPFLLVALSSANMMRLGSRQVVELAEGQSQREGCVVLTCSSGFSATAWDFREKTHLNE